MTDTTARHVYAKNRWHAAWVLLGACVRHPNGALVIHIGGKR